MRSGESTGAPPAHPSVPCDDHAVYSPVPSYPAAPYPAGLPHPIPAPASRPALGDRGPWWVRTLISAAIAVVFYLASVAMQVTLNQLHAHGWVTIAAWGVLGLVFAAVLAVWGRNTSRRILAPLVAIMFLVLQRGVQSVWVIWGEETYDWTETSVKALAWSGMALLNTGVILGWTIARRRTGFTWIGLLPVTGIVAVAVWVNWARPYIDNDVVHAVASNGIDFGFWILAILIFWACDGIGIASRRNRPTPPPNPFTSYPGPGTPLPVVHIPVSPGQPGAPSPVWPPQPPPRW